VLFRSDSIVTKLASDGLVVRDGEHVQLPQ
jgi:hypothetical protein